MRFEVFDADAVNMDMLGEGFRKVTAARLVGDFGPLLAALGENAQLYQWLRCSQPFAYFPHRFELYEYVQTRYVAALPLDYLEFGVARGDSLLRWAELNTHPDSRLVGFDTFTGLPEEWRSVTGSAPRGSFSTGGAVPITTDRRVRFVKGLFKDTLRGFLEEFEPNGRLMVHIDADLYSSTLFVLATIDPILNPGTVVIFDEFANPLHEWKAFRDYMVAFGRAFKVIGASGGYYTQLALELIG